MLQLSSKSRLYLILVLFLVVNQLATYFTVKKAQTPVSAQAPLNQANHSLAAVEVWANTATVDLYSYNYNNIEKRLNVLSKYFTSGEWQAYLQELKKADLINNLHNKKLLVSSVALAPVQIIKHGVANNRYQWSLSFPLLVSYANDKGQTTQRLSIKMEIVRQSSLTHSSGLAISHISATVIPPPAS